MNKEIACTSIDPNEVTINVEQLTVLSTEFYSVNVDYNEDDNGELLEICFYFNDPFFATEFLSATKCFRKV